MTPYVHVAPPIDTTHTDTTGIDTTAVGIHELSILDSQFSIYPNPTSGKVTITSPASLVSAIVTDMMGRQVYTKTIKQSNIVYRTDGTPQAITIDLSHLPQGAYFLTLTTASGKSHTLKLIVNSECLSSECLSADASNTQTFKHSNIQTFTIHDVFFHNL